jgi:hypothetical protein
MQFSPVRPRRIDPHRRRTSAHQRRLGLEGIGHRLKLAAEFDQQPVTLVAFEEFVFLENVGKDAQARLRSP